MLVFIDEITIYIDLYNFHVKEKGKKTFPCQVMRVCSLKMRMICMQFRRDSCRGLWPTEMLAVWPQIERMHQHRLLHCVQSWVTLFFSCPRSYANRFKRNISQTSSVLPGQSQKRNKDEEQDIEKTEGSTIINNKDKLDTVESTVNSKQDHGK